MVGGGHSGSSSPNGNILHVTDNSFEQDILKSSGAVVLDFWAPWCAPCRTLGSTLEQLAPEFAGRVTVAKMNVDDNPHTAGEFGIQSIPAMFFFRDGRPIGQVVGLVPANALRDLFTRHAEGTLAAE